MSDETEQQGNGHMTHMTLEEATSRVDAIKQARRDPERAHVMEDQLYVDLAAFIWTDPRTDPEVAAIARTILTSRSVIFQRNCA